MPIEPRLDLQGGHIHCRSHRPENALLGLPLDTGSLAALRHIVTAPLGRVFAFTLGEGGAAHLGAAAEGYVLAQLERGFRTLEFLKQFEPLSSGE